ncbi:MAG: hypothetical protein HWE07_06180 [Cytophagia bacterium]|nr:hypothetical protein [Cytophagia bacterium]
MQLFCPARNPFDRATPSAARVLDISDLVAVAHLFVAEAFFEVYAGLEFFKVVPGGSVEGICFSQEDGLEVHWKQSPKRI